MEYFPEFIVRCPFTQEQMTIDCSGPAWTDLPPTLVAAESCCGQGNVTEVWRHPRLHDALRHDAICDLLQHLAHDHDCPQTHSLLAAKKFQVVEFGHNEGIEPACGWAIFSPVTDEFIDDLLQAATYSR
jgi:hypothetical protein